jgi:hypothetical protein
MRSGLVVSCVERSDPLLEAAGSTSHDLGLPQGTPDDSGSLVGHDKLDREISRIASAQCRELLVDPYNQRLYQRRGESSGRLVTALVEFRATHPAAP